MNHVNEFVLKCFTAWDDVEGRLFKYYDCNKCGCVVRYQGLLKHYNYHSKENDKI